MGQIEKSVGDALASQLIRDLKAEILPEIKKQVESIDIEGLIRDAVKNDLVDMLKDLSFPKASIPATAINFNNFKLSGDHINGGELQRFSSAGIEDLAEDTQLTVMNNMIVVEDKIVTRLLDVKGNVTIDGNLNINGEIPLPKNIENSIINKLSIQFDKKLTKEMNTRLKTISGDVISGGRITKFKSEGIEDFADDAQLTVLNDMVVVENKLVAQNLSVRGDTTIDGSTTIKGNLTILGDMPLDEKTRKSIIAEVGTTVHEQVSEDIKEELLNSIVSRIKATEFDVKNIVIGGRKLLDGENSLAPHIRKTRITETGPLTQLIVQGEALIHDTFYTGNKRVGINTKEPAAALTIRDEEVEIVTGKHSPNTGYVGTLRPLELILGAHNKTNIVLGTAGQTLIHDLIADKTRFFSADKVPNFAGDVGNVCFNTTPALDKPWGWICLGGARWGVMGNVE